MLRKNGHAKKWLASHPITFVFSYLWSSGNRTRLHLSAALLGQGITTAFALLVPYLLGNVIQAITERRDASVVLAGVVLYALAWTVGEMLDRLAAWCVVSATERARRLASRDLAAFQLVQPLSASLKVRAGEVTARMP